MEERSWKLSAYQICVHYALFLIFIYLFFLLGQHNPFQDKSTSSLLPGAKSLMFDNPQWLTAIFCESISNLQLHHVNEAKTALKLCDDLTSFCEVTMSMYEVKGHFWGMCDLQSSLCMRSEVGIWCERCNWRSHMPRNWLLTSSILIVTSQHDVTSGVARWGSGGQLPPGRNSAPLLPPPPWNHTLYRGLWWVAILSPSQPPSPEPPLPPPHFEVWLCPWMSHGHTL